MTKSKMMVTRQPIRMGVLLSSCGYVADGLAAAGKSSEMRRVGFEGVCEAAERGTQTDAPLLFTGTVGQCPGEQKVIPVVVMLISSLTVGEVTIRITGVGRMVSSDEGQTSSNQLKISCVCKIECRNCVCLTRLKRDLTEHHPDVGKVKVAAEGFSSSAVERHGHIAGTRVLVVQHCLECHRLRLPFGNEAGLKPTGDGGEDLHAAGEHVVTVNLEAQIRLTDSNFHLQQSSFNRHV